MKVTFTNAVTGEATPARLIRARSHCIFCGRILVPGDQGPRGKTRDHVPPTCLFTKDTKPTDLITAPACRRCNSQSQLDDELFRIFAVTEAADHHPVAREILRQAVVGGTFRRHPRLRHRLAKGMFDVELVTPGGIHLGPRSAVQFDHSRIDAVLRKLVLGLMWWHYDLSPGMAALEFQFKANPTQELQADLVKTTNLSHVGDGTIFAYRHAIDVNDARRSLWLFRFYECTVVVGHTEPTPHCRDAASPPPWFAR